MKQSILVTLVLLSSSIISIANASETTLQEQLNNLKTRVEELEIENSLNPFSYNMSLLTQAFAIEHDKKDLALYRLKGSLDQTAVVTDQLDLYSRIIFGKYFNNLGTAPTGSDFDSAISFSGPELYAERFYFDYKMKSLPLVISLGRLPTIDGPPSHYYDDRPRLNTFPRLAYNSTLDGVALTNKNVGESWDSTYRFLYTPLGLTALDSQHPLGKVDGFKDNHFHAFTGMIELNLKKPTVVFSEFNFIAQLTGYEDATFGNYSLNSNSITFQNKAYDIYLFNTNFEFKDLFFKGHDLYFSHLLTHLINNKAAAVTPSGQSTRYLGLMKDSTGTVNGHFILLGQRLRIDSAKAGNSAVGYEYVYGNKEAFGVNTSGTSDEPLGFYSVNGHGLHLYYGFPVSLNFRMRLGYRQKYTKWEADSVNNLGLGALIRSETKTESIYLSSIVEI